jgi:3-methyladenine DNA glycosylase AlkD
MFHSQEDRMTPASPAQVAAATKRQLAALARPAGQFDASRYFRGAPDLGFHNIGTKRMRALAKEIYRAHREVWSVDEAMAFADELMPDRHLETKGLAIEVVACYHRALPPRLLPAWKRWLADGHSSNWATTDAICGLLIGPLVSRQPALQRRVAAWAGDRNMWVRRAAAVGLIPSLRRGAALDLAYGVARRLHSDEEDLIQKAVGWMLREAGKTDATRLERYLRANGASIPRTTMRYAIERFPPAKRRTLLRDTARAVRRATGRMNAAGRRRSTRSAV